MEKFHKWQKILFPLPVWAEFLLFAACCAGLVWVFISTKEQSAAAYVIFVLSAYSLTALCFHIPKAVSGGKAWLQRHPRVSEKLLGREFRFRTELYIEQAVNFAYGIFKIISGIVIPSAWIGADGIYNLAQALIQSFQISRRKNPGSISDQWRSYRFCGVLILLMHLTLTGIVFQMVRLNRVWEQGEIMLITTAAFAFYRLISSFLHLAKDRKHRHPIDSSVRMLKWSQAIFAIFSLQVGLLHSYGNGEPWEAWMNMASGGAVCLLVAATGVYMICRGSRELRDIQENNNGNR